MSNDRDDRRPRFTQTCISSFERKRIFDRIYDNDPSLNVDDEFFKKDSVDLLAEDTEYDQYCDELENVELKIALNKFDIARDKIITTIGEKVDKIRLISLCNKIGSLLHDLFDKNLNEQQKKKDVIKIITECTQNDNKSRNILFHILRLKQVETVRIPTDSNQNFIPPSCMNSTVQKKAAKNGENFIYPYPFNVSVHFPVFYCNPVFVNFIDILDNREKNNVVGEYKRFLTYNFGTKSRIDSCIYDLIGTMVSPSYGRKEEDFVKKIFYALNNLFTYSEVRSSVPLSEINQSGDLTRDIVLDAAVMIGNFPFIIFEAKNHNYSINSVLEALQYYGLTNAEFIENDPCFLITFDRGILYIYGVAKVNTRVVCSCLQSLEFTSYFYNVRNFLDTLFNCLGALLFFFEKFSGRIRNKANDSQHIKYSLLKSTPSHNSEPLPAILSVKKADDSGESIEISFEPTESESFLKNGVYRVKIGEGYAILKILHIYNVEIHKTLANANLAPKLLGHELLCDKFHVILMEYLKPPEFDMVFNYINNDPRINYQRLKESLRSVLVDLKRLKVVHGDFRSNNILAKRSSDDPTILEDFKLIDFELSGAVGTSYPCLAIRNTSISWPSDFSSFASRKFEHDEHLLNHFFELKRIR